MAGKRKADPKTAVKSKAAKAKAAAATDEAGKPSRETTSGFLTSLKYKALHGKGNDKVNAQQLLQAGGFLGLGVCAAGRVEVSVWGLVFSSSVFRGLGGWAWGLGAGIYTVYIYMYYILYIYTHYNMLYML